VLDNPIFSVKDQSRVIILRWKIRKQKEIVIDER
jgi:hypothetical protein